MHSVQYCGYIVQIDDTNLDIPEIVLYHMIVSLPIEKRTFGENNCI